MTGSSNLCTGSQLPACSSHLFLLQPDYWSQLCSFFFFFFGQVITLLCATSSTIQANQQTIWSQVRNLMASLSRAGPSAVLHLTKVQEQAVLRRSPELVWHSAGQPKLPSHVTNSLLCYSKFQTLVEFELCFQLGFEGCWTGVIALSVCLCVCRFPTFLLPVTSGLMDRFQPSLREWMMLQIQLSSARIMRISSRVERDKLAPLFQRKAVKRDYFTLFGSNLWLACGCVLLSCVCNPWLDS